MRYAQLVIGPAGCGKSTYCSTMATHGAMSRRSIDVVNLDPAAEHFSYEPLIDIRSLIQVQDAMEDEELQLGPNGGLVFCMEYLMENKEWLREQLGEGEEDYILFDCPGQIELYTHLKVMKKLIQLLQDMDFNVCAVYLMDVQFMVDGAKFISGSLCALSVMVNLEIPHVNLLSKMDLLSKNQRKRLDRFLEPDIHALLGNSEHDGFTAFSDKYQRLTEALGDVVENYSLVKFIQLNIKDPESLSDILITIDNAIQYGEEQDVRTFDCEDPDDDKNDSKGPQYVDIFGENV